MLIIKFRIANVTAPTVDMCCRQRLPNLLQAHLRQSWRATLAGMSDKAPYLVIVKCGKINFYAELICRVLGHSPAARRRWQDEYMVGMALAAVNL